MTASKHNRQPSNRPRKPRTSLERPEKWEWHLRTLLALRDHLRGSMGDREREPCDPLESPSLHAEDLVDELYDRELAAALPSDSAVALREIEDALLRIKAGTYGRCERTGRAIPRDELRALPWRRSPETRRSAPRYKARSIHRKLG